MSTLLANIANTTSGNGVQEVDIMTRTLADATGDSSEIRNDAGMFRSALVAAEASELESEITEIGRGATIYHAFASHGMVPIREFASWICVEKMCSRVRDGKRGGGGGY